MEKTKEHKNSLVRRLHALRGAVGMRQDEYDALLGSYGVESSRDLSVEQLSGLIRFLQGQADSRAGDREKMRRRLLAAVCGFCEDTVDGWERMDGLRRLEYAKTVACRAAGLERKNSHGRDNFNALGLDRMRSLAFAFSKRKKDMNGVVDAMHELMAGGAV